MSGLTGKRVLVTGSDGFIGSHLVERLLDLGAEVRAFCLYNSNGHLGWLDDLDRERFASVEVHLGDIRDARFVLEAVEGAEVVFHLAALIGIPYSYEAPESFVDTNVRGTLNVLEAVRTSGADLMINTSTSEVYGTPMTLPISEDHPLIGQSPYSATKIAADKLCEAYALSFETPVVTLRPFNTYGPRQSARAVIPTILGQLLSGSTEVRLGSLDPERDFTYVTDTVEGFIKMAQARPAPATTIQLGSGTAVSIGELFQICCQVTGVQAEVVTEPERVRPERSEVRALLSNPERAQRELGWKPTVDLPAGIELTAKWLSDRVDPDRASRYHR